MTTNDETTSLTTADVLAAAEKLREVTATVAAGGNVTTAEAALRWYRVARYGAADSTEAIGRVVERVAYRHGWLFSVVGFGGYVEIAASLMTVDADRGEPGFQLGHRVAIDPTASEERVVAAVFAMIAEIEDHERREFFRYRGVKLYDPHASDAERAARAARCFDPAPSIQVSVNVGTAEAPEWLQVGRG